MNAQESISASGFPQGTGAMTLGVKEPGALAFLDKITQTTTAAHAIPLALQEKEAKFQKEICRRDENPFATGWDHGGLNE
ncbi:MAG: hypothetical protein WCS42_13305 [Verrucomicrobiota bacterium]